MASVTHAVATPDTGATPNTSGSFTPAEGDLLIVWVHGTGTAETTATLTSSVGGFTFSQFAVATTQTLDKLFGFVSDALVGASPSSQTVTFTIPADQCTGSCIVVQRVSGMTKYGLTAIRQSAKTDGDGSNSGTTPSATFSSSVLTGNPTLVAVGNHDNPAAVTEPSGWTESADIGYNTPTTGLETAYRNSGFTGTTITWGSTTDPHGELIVELDASATATKKGGFGLMGMGR